jgi:hypothetical protein
MMPGTGIGRSHPPRKNSFFFLSLSAFQLWIWNLQK